MNSTLKRSRQRDAILSCVKDHHDHPTADVIYQEVRKTFPNISLGTVYRNLGLLTQLGQIRKINCGDNNDHFDGFTPAHAHFYCTHCGALLDFPEEIEPHLEFKNTQFKGKVLDQCILLSGLCEKCTDA